MKLHKVSTKTQAQVFHSNSWNLFVDDEIIKELLNEAKQNSSNKARLCLHRTSDELLQVTYIAFVAPYEDKIHSHPHRPEVLIPIIGEAEARIFDDQGKVLTTQVMRGKSGEAFSSAVGTWHGLEIITPEFVMIEVGLGPFKDDSTLFLSKHKD
jgi:cupin fold WbuC family metalloprotein